MQSSYKEGSGCSAPLIESIFGPQRTYSSVPPLGREVTFHCAPLFALYSQGNQGFMFKLFQVQVRYNSLCHLNFRRHSGAFQVVSDAPTLGS